MQGLLLLSALSGFFAVLCVVYQLGHRAGADAIKRGDAEHKATLAANAMKAAAAAPRGREAILKRLKEGGGL